ncbi:hypothetical protein TorRG33x02_130710 [Trema orientale]|uniref:Uncharacterized protein n=1 Tax=Trema orientale TaxID=63057 RepID=A0A2P5EZS6_TREOI|nr:hypothetical protein TorRG33x02_130710 [Trema orientale]
MESLLNDFDSSLSLTVDEQTIHPIAAVDLEDDERLPTYTLIGRVLSLRPYNKEASRKLWLISGSGVMTFLSLNWMLASSYSNSVVLVTGGGCFLVNHGILAIILVVLGVPDAMTHISVDSLTNIPFWIQIYRLPFLSKSKALGKMIGEWVGDFLEVDTASLLEGWSPYMRIRVSLDVSKPLFRGKMLKLPQCLENLELEDQGLIHNLPYGPWMRGTPPKTTGIDRYRLDFSQASAWPLLTHLVHTTTGPSLTRLSTAMPHPQDIVSSKQANDNTSGLMVATRHHPSSAVRNPAV